MSDRLQAHLDGELSSDDLTPEERLEAAAWEGRVGALRSTLDELGPQEMDVRVMKRIAELGLEPLPAGRTWAVRRSLVGLFAAREVRFRWRPIYALAAAAALAAVVLVPSLTRNAGESSGSVQGVDGGAAPVYVQFRLMASDAQQVALAGSFSEWRPAHALNRSADGVWTVLLPLTPGVHDYLFIVDGTRWVPDPYAQRVDDGFGGSNSRLTLLTPAL